MVRESERHEHFSPKNLVTSSIGGGGEGGSLGPVVQREDKFIPGIVLTQG